MDRHRRSARSIRVNNNKKEDVGDRGTLMQGAGYGMQWGNEYGTMCVSGGGKVLEEGESEGVRGW